MNKKKTKEDKRLLPYLLLQAGFDDIGQREIVAKPGRERTPLRGDLDKKRQLVCDEGAGCESAPSIIFDGRRKL